MTKTDYIVMDEKLGLYIHSLGNPPRATANIDMAIGFANLDDARRIASKYLSSDVKIGIYFRKTEITLEKVEE